MCVCVCWPVVDQKKMENAKRVRHRHREMSKPQLLQRGVIKKKLHTLVIYKQNATTAGPELSTGVLIEVHYYRNKHRLFNGALTFRKNNTIRYL